MKSFIQIKKEFLILREDAKKLAQKAKRKNIKTIFFDFSRVRIMSRGFVDEFLNEISKLKEKGIKVRLWQINSDLRKFISKVKKTKKEIQKFA